MGKHIKQPELDRGVPDSQRRAGVRRIIETILGYIGVVENKMETTILGLYVILMVDPKMKGPQT